MAKNSRVLVDTDILIKIFRGDKGKREILESIQDQLAISMITAMELMKGAPTKKREFEVLKTVKAYFLYDLNLKIGTKAFSIIKKYHLHNTTGIADTLIAATAIENYIPLYTDNVSDYSFITELELFKPQ